MPSHPAARSCLDDLARTRAEDLFYRNSAEQESTCQSQQQRDSVNAGIRVHNCTHRSARKWLPYAQPAQKHNGTPQSDSTARERNQHGFGEELPENAQAAGAQTQPQSNLTRTVRGAGGKQAPQVGADRQQNQAREEHQSRKKCTYRRSIAPAKAKLHQ